MTIGMNLGDIEDWSTDWIFVDQFKMARTVDDPRGRKL